MAGLDSEHPLTEDRLRSLLPSQIMAYLTDGSRVPLDITWYLSWMPEEGLSSGDYMFRAVLPQGYELGNQVQKLELHGSLGGRDSQDLRDHLVETVEPGGTTIHLFDYWLDDPGAPDYLQSGRIENLSEKGINQGHTLNFTTGSSSGFLSINQYTPGANQGIVQPLLKDGYPVLARENPGESLAYLFDPADQENGVQPGKAAYTDVGGLLQIDENGYYYYDAVKNYAAYDPGTNMLEVYDKQGVKENYSVFSSDREGQFFPFNTASEVLKRNGDGNLILNDITAGDPGINHWFGMALSSRFVQQEGGTNRGLPVTYEFSGDDDVWIFIDGVLVGDLGGIHGKTGISINFATGEVTVTEGNRVSSKSTTIRAMFEKAGAADTVGWSEENPQIFADNTYHTLNFFYLERGSGASNLSLKYNLVNIPESSVIKVDQTGTPIQGVGFSIYAADAAYSQEGIRYLSEGVTDGNGSLIFKNPQGQILRLSDVYQENCQEDGNAYLLLRETDPPPGYRAAEDIRLRLSDVNGYVVPYSDNSWETGALAAANLNVSVGETIRVEQDTGTVDVNLDTDKGTLFAAVVKKDGSGNLTGVITGDPKQGFAVQPAGTKEDILRVLREYPRSCYSFYVDSSGAYKTVIDGLPGDVAEYGDLMEEGEQAGYDVYYYYTSAASASQAAAENTFPVRSGTFDREVSAGIYVPNIKNHLYVRKTDTEGNPLDGAVICLYRAAPDGSFSREASLLEDVTATRTGPCTEGDPDTCLTGEAVFPVRPEKILEEGVYYVWEESAPSGYLTEPVPVKVIVSREGVFADGGMSGDAVQILLSPGELVKNMTQFADPALMADPPLQNVEAAVYRGQESEGSFSWEETPEEVRPARYGPQGLPEGEVPVFTVDEGWERLGVLAESGSGSLAPSAGTNLTALFAGKTTVCLSNRKETASLTLCKEVEGDYGDRTRRFSFHISLAFPEGGGEEPRSFPISGYGETDSLVFTGGEAEVLLAHGESVTISRLPASTEYRITEEPAEGYQTGYEVNGRETAEPPAGTLGPDQREQIRTVNIWPEAPETGIRSGSMPAALPGGLALLPAGALGLLGILQRKQRLPGRKK